MPEVICQACESKPVSQLLRIAEFGSRTITSPQVSRRSASLVSRTQRSDLKGFVEPVPGKFVLILPSE